MAKRPLAKKLRLLPGNNWAEFDGMTWPTPMDHPDGGLEWRLRYGSTEQLIKDRYCAASIVEAYQELILCDEKKRNAVIKQLRRAVRLQSKPAGDTK